MIEASCEPFFNEPDDRMAKASASVHERLQRCVTL